MYVVLAARLSVFAFDGEKGVLPCPADVMPIPTFCNALAARSRDSSSRGLPEYSRPKTLLVGSSVTATDIGQEHFSPTQVRTRSQLESFRSGIGAAPPVRRGLAGVRGCVAFMTDGG